MNYLRAFLQFVEINKENTTPRRSDLINRQTNRINELLGVNRSLLEESDQTIVFLLKRLATLKETLQFNFNQKY